MTECKGSIYCQSMIVTISTNSSWYDSYHFVCLPAWFSSCFSCREKSKAGS